MQGFVAAGTITAAKYTLCQHQIDICQTEHGIVDVGSNGTSIGCCLSGISQIGKLLSEVTLALVVNGLSLPLLLTVSIEHIAAVTTFVAREQCRQFTTDTEHAPAASQAVFGRILRTGVSTLATDDIRSSPPSNRINRIHNKWEDNFIGSLVIVGIEQFAVVRLQ